MLQVHDHATGLRVYGAGEWRVWKHRVCRRRTWRKLHLGVDESTKELVAVELTGGRVRETASSCPFCLTRVAIPSPKCQAMGPTTRGPATRQCSSVRPRQPSCPGARPDWASLRIRPYGVLRAIASCSSLKPRDARRGGHSVGARGRVSRRIQCSGSSSCSGDSCGHGGTPRHAPRRW